VDERFDPEKSTRAYARYMKYIYGQLATVPLNGRLRLGSGNIQRAVQKTGYAISGSCTSATIFLPKPKTTCGILAAIIIAITHAVWFDDISSISGVTDTVTINYQVDLRLCRHCGRPMDEMWRSTPAVALRYAGRWTVRLHLPAVATLLSSASRDSESKRNGWRYHRMPRETPWPRGARVSRERNRLAAANQLREATTSRVEAL